MIVGIESGYHYKPLEEDFNNGTITKDEAPNGASLIQKLIAKRNDAVIMDELLFQHTLKKLNLDKNLFQKSLMITEAPLSMKLHGKHKATLPAFNQAIDALQKDGTIQETLQRYTN